MVPFQWELAVSQIREMNLSVEYIQPEPEFKNDSFVRCLEIPSYWSQLGSKNRTSEQQDRGKELAQNLTAETPGETILCFTDGSCISNPAPCRAGVVIYLPEGEQEVHITHSVAASALLAPRL